MLNKKLLTGLALSIFMIFTVCSCNTQEQTVTPIVEPGLTVPNTELSRSAGSQFIRLKANGDWSLKLEFGENISPWASIDKSSGVGTTSGIVLSWEENTGDTSRSFSISLINGKESTTVSLIQPALGGGGSGGNNTPPTELKADIPGKWLELPATDDPDLYFFTHGTTLKGKQVRNYSFYYDVEARLSPWVAYPLYKSIIGEGSRTNAWGYDPKIPVRYQQVLFKGYSGRYDRGHQLPSADRLNRNDNISTFYFTNMTPQKGELNQNVWASLEGRVRDWCYQMDTLYVVTGADLRGSTASAYDNDGNEIPVPTGYYKALLGYKKSASFGQATGGYIGIAFYFEHKSYSDYMARSMSIDALEDKLGIDFFVNLPSVTDSGTASSVESKVDSWWKNN